MFLRRRLRPRPCHPQRHQRRHLRLHLRLPFHIASRFLRKEIVFILILNAGVFVPLADDRITPHAFSVHFVDRAYVLLLPPLAEDASANSCFDCIPQYLHFVVVAAMVIISGYIDLTSNSRRIHTRVIRRGNVAVCGSFTLAEATMNDLVKVNSFPAATTCIGHEVEEFGSPCISA